MMNLASWAEAAQGTLIGENRSARSVCIDSRTLKAGDVFFAVKGPNFDGHDYLAQAAQQGAAAVVVVRAEPTLNIPQILVADTVEALGKIASAWRAAYFHGTLFAITGSCGKTTVKGMLKSICEQAGSTLATTGNLNNHLGVPLTLLSLQPTHKFAVVEMGASGMGEIAYLTQLAVPDVALVNNVMAAHIEGFGSLASVREEKLRIYEGLKPNGIAVINLDDAYASEAMGLKYRKIGFSLNAQAVADGCLTSLADNANALDSGAWAFEWKIEGTQVSVKLAVLGKHNLANALAAASMAFAAGIPASAIQAGLAAFTGEKGRMQAKSTPTGAILIDDTYNANPGSVAAAIAYLAQRPGERILVLGDMKELGQNAAAEHAAIGQLARNSGVDQLFTCGNLTAAAAEAFGPKAQHFASQDALLAAVKPLMQSTTTCLIKGSRSARMEHIVEGLLAVGE